MQTELLELALRVEAATGPVRELDKAIYAAMGGCNHERTERYAYQDDTGFTCLDCGEDTYGAKLAPTYTASLDAAMTLVPEGHTIQLSDWDHEILRAKGAWQAIVLPMGARGAMKDYTFSNRCDHAATPALALCAAALRALAAQKGENVLFDLEAAAEEGGRNWLKGRTIIPLQPMSEAPPEFMDEGERRRWEAGRHDWQWDRWQDHCGDYDCEVCTGYIPDTKPRVDHTPTGDNHAAT